MADNSLSDFLTFRKFLTPLIIQILFWIGAVLSFIGGIIIIAQGNIQSVFAGLGAMIFGPILWRILCEVMIINFRIHENLKAIRESKGA